MSIAPRTYKPLDGGKQYTLRPVFIDQIESRIRPHTGAVVEKVQPFGCPPSGTMGHVWVQRSDTKEFIGLVHKNSLVPVVKPKGYYDRITVPYRKIVRETAKATLFFVKNSEVWIPKSVYKLEGEKRMTVPKWFAEQKEWLHIHKVFWEI